MIKTVIFGLILGVTLGVSLASEVFNMFGMKPEIYLITMVGLLIAILVIHRGTAVVAAFIALSMAVMQPEQVLIAHGFDRDLLLAALVSIVVYPVVYKVMHS